ncbi:unnamed protein product [Brassica oleracea var. botrytis]
MAARSLPGAVKSLFSTAFDSVSRSIVLRRNYVATSPGLLSKGGSTRVTVGKLEQSANRGEARTKSKSRGRVCVGSRFSHGILQTF